MSTLAIEIFGCYGQIDRISGARGDMYRYCVKSARAGKQLVEGYAGDLDEALDSLHLHARYIVDEAHSSKAA